MVVLLPAPKVSAEIAVTRGVPMGEDCISPARHSAFDTPEGLLHFIARLRELSGPGSAARESAHCQMKLEIGSFRGRRHRRIRPVLEL